MRSGSHLHFAAVPSLALFKAGGGGLPEAEAVVPKAELQAHLSLLKVIREGPTSVRA